MLLSRKASVTAFFRRSGYNAVPSGNNTASTIPYAIQAGPGKLGRHGLLIQRKYRSTLRLAKVCTSFPLKLEKPIQFGVQDYCLNCNLCASACSVQCITYSEPTREISNDAADPGMK